MLIGPASRLFLVGSPSRLPGKEAQGNGKPEDGAVFAITHGTCGAEAPAHGDRLSGAVRGYSAPNRAVSCASSVRMAAPIDTAR